MANQTKNPPVKKFNDQYVTVAVWENVTEKGTFRNITTEHTYKDGDGKYKSTNTIPGALIPVANELQRMAYFYIVEQRAADREQDNGDQQ